MIGNKIDKHIAKYCNMANNCLCSNYVHGDFCTVIYNISMIMHEHVSLLFHIFKIKFRFYKVHLKYIKKVKLSLVHCSAAPLELVQLDFLIHNI